MDLGTVSVIIPGRNEGENLLDTVACALDNAGCPSVEIVVVDDGSTDGTRERVSDQFGRDPRVALVRTEGVGVAGARNAGARAARGEIVVFLDGHCYAPPGWLSALVLPLTDPTVGMVGPACANLGEMNGPRGMGMVWRDAMLDGDWLAVQADTPYAVPLLPGCCQALRKADFERLGGYDSGMSGWGSEDHELSLRCWLMGYSVVGQPQTLVYHLYRETSPYHRDVTVAVYNKLRMALLHLSPARVAQVMERHKPYSEFTQVMIWLLHSDVMVRRKQFQEQRKRHDDWYCAQFRLAL